MVIWVGGGNEVSGSVPSLEYRGNGRSARKLVPRKTLADWNPDTRGHDALATILAQNEMRDERLIPIRHGRMSFSPWTYYRGAAAVMAADLASAPHTDITVQLCGDAHVLNYGLWNTPERNLAFDLRDFDETLPGPFEWDVKRFLASLVVLAQSEGLSTKRAKSAVVSGFTGYRHWISTYAGWPELDIWYDRVDIDTLSTYLTGADDLRFDKIMEKRAGKRTSRAASKKLVDAVDGKFRIKEDPPYRVHDLGPHVATLADVLGGYQQSVPDHISSLLARFDIVDAVQQLVGVGSVGMRVFLVLNLEHRTNDPLFIQVKQAGPSVYEQFLGASRYRNHGARVVNGQRMIQSATDMFVGWTSVPGQDYYVRQFRDGKVIPKGDAIAPILSQFASACGHVLARAHARSGDANAIDDYLGKGSDVGAAFTAFAFAYAEQNARDHAQLAKAVDEGRIPSAPGWPGRDMGRPKRSS